MRINNNNTIYYNRNVIKQVFNKRTKVVTAVFKYNNILYQKIKTENDFLNFQHVSKIIDIYVFTLNNYNKTCKRYEKKFI